MKSPILTCKRAMCFLFVLITVVVLAFLIVGVSAGVPPIDTIAPNCTTGDLQGDGVSNTIQLVLTCTHMATFVDSGTTTADGADLNKIKLQPESDSHRPSVATISGSELTLTFNAEDGTFTQNIDIDAGTLANANNLPNDAISISSTEIVDNAKPKVFASAISTPKLENEVGGFGFSLSNTEGGDVTYEGGCTTDNVNIGWTNLWTYLKWGGNPDFPEGDYDNCTITITDVAGNFGTGNVPEFIVDLAGPVLGDITVSPLFNNGGINYISATSNVSSPVTDAGTGVDPSSCWYSYDGGNNVRADLGNYVGGECVFTNLDTSDATGIVIYAKDNVPHSVTFNDSKNVLVTVDSTIPMASITSPTDGSTIGGIVTIVANASDFESGVAKVEFYHSSPVPTKIGEDTTDLYSMDWDTTGVSNGPHSVFIKAYDNVGNPTGYTSVSVTVDNCVDADGDGYNASSSGGSCGAIDCNDTNAAISPDATETCNGLDDNCESNIDEGFNIGGSCSSGSNTCGDINNGSYICSQDGLSSICDASTPAERPSWNQICYSSPNSCHDTNLGLTDCEGVCLATIPDERPSWNQTCTSNPNSCGDVNNGSTDCDGTCTAITPDERPSWNQTCTSNQNVCGETAQGTTDCNGICQAQIPTATDSDGDGIPDCLDNCVIAANADQSDCNSNGVGDACDSINPNADDSNCNGVDENCNGIADDAYISTPTSCGVGACASTGSLICSSGQTQDTCVQGTPTTETCNGIDDNCNGQVDDDSSQLTSLLTSKVQRIFPLLTQSCYTGPAETRGVGACSDGIQTCTNGTYEGASCESEVVPINETCDGIDNNCDSVIDDGNYISPNAFNVATTDEERICVVVSYYCDMDQDRVIDAIPSGSCDSFNCIPQGCQDTRGTDNIIGTVNDVQGNQNQLIFGVNQTQDPSSWDGLGHVIFTDGITGDTILEFDFDFAGNVLDLTKINITTSENSSAIVITGIDLTSQNITKTAYIKISSSNSVCILDIENATISQTSDCTGTDEISVECNGIATADGYMCTSINSTLYKVEGLKHSSVTQYTYTAPATTTTTGGGGGGACVTKWSCTNWGTCTAGSQNRVCSYPANYCAPTAIKPVETQTCIGTASNSNNNTSGTQTTTPTGTPGITGAVIGPLGVVGSWVLIGFIVLVLAGAGWLYLARRRKIA